MKWLDLESISLALEEVRDCHIRIFFRWKKEPECWDNPFLPLEAARIPASLIPSHLKHRLVGHVNITAPGPPQEEKVGLLTIRLSFAIFPGGPELSRHHQNPPVSPRRARRPSCWESRSAIRTTTCNCSFPPPFFLAMLFFFLLDMMSHLLCRLGFGRQCRLGLQ